MADALRWSDVATKRETVEIALREFVNAKECGTLARELAGKVQWVGDLHAMRRDSFLSNQVSGLIFFAVREHLSAFC